MGRLTRLHVQGDKVLEPMVTRSLPDGIPLPWVAHLVGAGGEQFLVGFTESKNLVGIVELGYQRGAMLA